MISFWVVERFEHGKSAGYWDGGSSRSFVPEIDKAVQFVRKQDAFWAAKGWHWNDTKITEHIMIGALEKTAEPTADPLPHSVITQTDSLHQCRTCGTYWRRWRGSGNWSLSDENQVPGKCCDNATDFLEQLVPPCADMPGYAGHCLSCDTWHDCDVAMKCLNPERTPA